VVKILYRNEREQGGFTYIWLLFTVAFAAIALAGVGLVWQTEGRREKEIELMFAGDQFRQAIGSFYESSPGLPKRYPDSLEKLLADDRFPVIKRHLRKIFIDPITGRPEWGLVRKPGLGIIGIHSLSSDKPLKRGNFPERYAAFSDAAAYLEWEFVYFPGEPGNNVEPSSQSQPQPDTQTQPQQVNEPGSSPPREGILQREGELSSYPIPPGS
jgi:hypothetical protein